MSTVDQWVDWGGHTVQVDPIRTAAWIHDGGVDKHHNTVNRGREYDARDVKHIQQLLNSHEVPTFVTFTPSVQDVMANRFPSRAQADSFSPGTEREQKCHDDDIYDMGGHRYMLNQEATRGLANWRGAKRDAANFGSLPVIRRKLDAGEFPDKSIEVIQREMLEAQQRVTDRVNDRSGKPDYGKMC